MRIAVVGGSLGGLTAALLLRDAGHDVTVYERSARPLEQRGAGIGFLRATARYLEQRTAVDLSTVSLVTDHLRYLDRWGTVTHDLTQRYRFSSWNAVYRQLLAHWDTERYRLGHDMVDFVPSGDTVEVRFAGGGCDRVDLLVCADGVGSTARRRLAPGAAAAYAGYVAWRGMVPEHELDPATTAALTDAITYHVHANSHLLAYPIPGLDGSVREGRRLVNFVWYRNYLEGPELDELLTDRHGVRHDLSLPPGTAADHHVAEVRAVAAARLPPVLAEVVTRTEAPFLQVVYDIEVDRMVSGRVCLLGDAAFAVRPHAAAGTAKAAQDGWALVDALAGASSVPAALQAWEATQLALGRSLLERTRRIGRRSQVDNSWTPGDPELVFGLFGPGDPDR